MDRGAVNAQFALRKNTGVPDHAPLSRRSNVEVSKSRTGCGGSVRLRWEELGGCMLSWFGNDAPIRTKFRFLLVVYSLIGLVAASAGCYAAVQAQGVNSSLLIS